MARYSALADVRAAFADDGIPGTAQLFELLNRLARDPIDPFDPDGKLARWLERDVRRSRWNRRRRQEDRPCSR